MTHHSDDHQDEQTGTTDSGTAQTGSAQSSLGSQDGGIGIGGASGTVNRGGSEGYSSDSDTPAGSLGSSVDSPHTESTPPER